MKPNEVKKLKRNGAKNLVFSFAKRSEKEAERFLFRFEAKINKKRKWDTLAKRIHSKEFEYI